MQDTLIKQAVKEFKTPLYLYDSEKIAHQYLQLRQHLPQDIDIFYSLKANPLIGIAQILKQLGASCEVCSLAELKLALHAGFAAQQIIFVGPGKSNEEIHAAINADIYAIVAESEDELHLINAYAIAMQKKVDVLLRVNPNFSVSSAPLKMGGRASQFGFEMQALNKILVRRHNFSQINFKGMHIYNATRILCANNFIENTRKILDLVDQIQKQHAWNCACIDIGGGIGIAYHDDEKSFDIQAVSSKLHMLVADYQKKYKRTRFILESGRFLVGESGILISKVLATKTSHGKHFLITDAGMNCHFASSILGSVWHRNFPIQLMQTSYPRVSQSQVYNISGPLCTPNDIVAKDITLTTAKKDDLIIISKVGAYGSSASLGRFLSHGYPAEVIYHQGRLNLVKRRENYQDIVNGQIKLPSYHLGEYKYASN